MFEGKCIGFIYLLNIGNEVAKNMYIFVQLQCKDILHNCRSCLFWKLIDSKVLLCRNKIIGEVCQFPLVKSE